MTAVPAAGRIRLRDDSQEDLQRRRQQHVGGVFICIRVWYIFATKRPYRLAVRTSPSHGGNRGSIPRRVTN